MKYSRLVLGTVLALAMTPAAHAGSFTDPQKKEIGDIVRQYIMDNPAIVFEAAQKHQQNEQSKADEAARQTLVKKKDEIFNNPSYQVLGDPKAKIAFAEFMDYNCGYCKHAYKDLAELVAEKKNVKIVLIDSPILGDSSVLAAKYALAARDFGPGKYLAYHAALMQFTGPKTEENLKKLATDNGMDPEKLKEAAMKPAIQDQINKNMALFRDLDLGGTPAFLTPDRIINNFMGKDTLMQIVKDAETKSGT